MEQFVLGIFQEQLSKFLVGFKKEQVNANLLNGKGEIRDVNINCSFINDLLCRLTPHIILEEIRVSKLGFNVTSWTNLKKAPIIVDIEDVYVTIVEPLAYADSSTRLTMKQLSYAEFKELIKDVKPRGTYNLFDRILDNLQVEIRSVNISFQPRGKFKTQRMGPWTPPRLLVTLRHVKYCSVNEFGHEATPEDCWRHNRFEGSPNQRSLLIFKKASMGVTMAFQDPGQPDDRLPPLMRDAKVEVHITFLKKWSNAAILALQVDATMSHVEIQLDREIVPVVAHAVAGMQYCFAKDRAFDDPLFSGISNEATDISVEVAMNSCESQDQDDNTTVNDEINRAELDEGVQAMILDEGAESVDGSKSVATEEGDDEDQGDEDEREMQRADSTNSKTSQGSLAGPVKRKSKDRPIIVLPSGIAIHQKISLSLSIQDCKIRGIYPNNTGHVQLQVKGLVVEAIWPKITKEKGGYLQMSLAFVTIEEKCGIKINTILQGGVHQDSRPTPVESPSAAKREIPRDENFPLFEDRSIRHDPLDLRHSFPAQAVGVKATINYVDKVASPELEEIMVLNEIGVDLFDITLESGSLGRAIRFAMNEGGTGFDPRWHSGDWTDELTTDMLVRPSQALNLSDHLQISPEIFLDENKLISSDLFNMTARISNISVKLPAAIERDIRSCDIVLHLGEIMLVVSSALPRTFLTGKIGSAIFGDGTSDPKIDFPNDPSDICYALREVEDPLIRQQGIETSRCVSTFRAQLTTRGVAVKTIPVIPFCDAEKPRDLLAPLEMTMIFCFEGEPPKNPEDDLIKIVVFQSIQIHALQFNCDFDMITGATSSLLFHAETINETIEIIKNLATTHPKTIQTTPEDAGESNAEVENRILSTIGGRKVLVKKQLERSRQTGGLSVECSLQIAEIGFSVWRQNIPLNSRFRASVTENRQRIDESPIPLVKLLSITLQDIEVGAEAVIQQPQRRIVLKSCISGLRIEACDFEKLSSRHLQELEKIQMQSLTTEVKQTPQAEINETRQAETNQQAASTEDNQQTPSHDDKRSVHETTANTKQLEVSVGRVDEMVSLVTIGGEKDIMFRLEDRNDEYQSVSIAADLDAGGVITLHVNEIEMFFLLLVEALLMPTAVTRNTNGFENQSRIQFPDGSIGSLLMALISPVPREKKREKPKVDVKKMATESNSVDEFMHNLVLSFFPENIGEMLARFIIGNLLIFVPHHSTSKNTGKSAPWLGHNLRQASILSAYLGSTSSSVKDALVQRLGKQGTTWTSLFGDQEVGFHHKISTSQGLYSAELESSEVVLKSALINKFDIGLTYGPQTIELSVGDSTLSLQDLSNMRDLHSSFFAFIERFDLMIHRIRIVTAGLVKDRVEKLPIASGTKLRENVQNTHPNEIVDDAELSLQHGRNALEKLKYALEKHDAEMRSILRRKQDETDRLRIQVFLKERSRVAALALVSCQAAGWLRLGGMHMYGERTLTTASMWRYHAVLRRSLLIFYAAPGKPRPLDVVNLIGARLLTLAGGRRKRDVKNGFAIRERSGCIRYVLALNDQELDSWVSELQKAIRDFSVDGTLEEDEDLAVDDLGGVPENVDISPDEMRLRARTLSSDIEGLNDSTHGGVDTPRRSSQLREKLSLVSASTRNTIGTAVQAAKERRHKGTDHQGISSGNLDEEFQESCQGNDEGIEQVVPDIDCQNVVNTPAPDASTRQQPVEREFASDVGPPRLPGGPKLANLRSNAKSKFGSAMRGAKEKALAVAEERRRQKQATVEVDETIGRKVFGLRGRLEHVATAVKNRSTDGETIAPSVSSSGLDKVNNDQLAAPLNDDSFPSQEDETSVGEEQSITPSRKEVDMENETVDELDDSQIDRAKAGSKLRTKFSKLGAAVKTAAQNQKARAAHGEDEGAKSSRFSIRRSKAPNSVSLESDLLKLKGLRIAGGYRSSAAELGLDGTPTLAKIKGSWTVHVMSQQNLSSKKITKSEDARRDDMKGVETAMYDLVSEEDSCLPVSFRSDTREEQSAEKCENFFSVRVLSQDPETQTKIKVFEVSRDFQNVIGLFIDITESVASMPQKPCLKSFDELRDATVDMKEELAQSLGIAPIDIVKLTGDLLGGLLSSSSSFHSIAAFHEYQCEVLAAFLNAALACLMPIDACTTLLEFLSIPGAITMDMGDDLDGLIEDFSPSSNRFDTAVDDIPVARTREIISLVSTCHSHLLRAEASGILAQRLNERKPSPEEKPSKLRKMESMPLTAPFLDPLLPASISDRLRDAMHSALNSIMKQRDEAHAQLIATNVLHVHEMESERKQVEIAKRKLQFAIEQSKRQQGLFAERFRDPAARDLQRYLEQMVKNSDNEIQKLCKELANEVCEKTQANFETFRLKESLRIERERDAAEKQALEDELRKAREQVAEANAKVRAAEMEALRLKEELDKFDRIAN